MDMPLISVMFVTTKVKTVFRVFTSITKRVNLVDFTKEVHSHQKRSLRRLFVSFVKVLARHSRKKDDNIWNLQSLQLTFLCDKRPFML